MADLNNLEEMQEMTNMQRLAQASIDAVKKFAADRSKENLIELMQVLENGVVFVPVVADTQMTKEQLKNASSVGGKLVLPPGTAIKNHLLKTTDGDYIFPVFTGVTEITSEEMKEQVLMMPFYECAKVVVNSNGYIKGAVVNPFTDNVAIIPELLKTCVDRRNAINEAKKNQPSDKMQEVKVTEKQFHTIVRNQLELRSMPEMLYKGKKGFVEEVMTRKGSFLHELYVKAYGSKVPCPYQLDEFSVMSLNIRENFELVSIDLPSKKLQAGMCYKIYLTWDQEKDEFHFFAMQKVKDGRNFVEVNPDGKFNKLGDAPEEGTELSAVMDYLKVNA